MNKHLIGIGLVTAFVAVSAFTVSADDHRRRDRFTATLTGFEETPLTISTGARKVQG
jgi:hypothetical protein